MSSIWSKKPLSLMLSEMEGSHRLRRVLGPVSLASLGIGSTIGTGIFVLTGLAVHDKAGPALVLSYLVAGLACVFAAFCYAEFASMVPVAGSTYNYAYATLGELFAWIIGWDLILEYAVAAASVINGWTGYFLSFLDFFGWHLPKELTMAPFDYNPQLGRIVATSAYFDLPCLLVTAVICVILVRGIKESSALNNLMVGIKIAVILFVIAVGVFYIQPENWRPFAPFGYAGISFFGHTVWGREDAGGAPLGMLSGAAIVFFSYIGFESVSTHAEEAKNPRRDLPIGLIASLVVCTVLYVGVTLVLTGMVPTAEIDTRAPVAAAFKRVGLPWAQVIISLGALTGITSVLLVTVLSQARIFLAIARDGLLPAGFFGAVHPRWRTPWKATIATSVFVGLLAAFVPLSILADLVNIGTLLAFVIVCLSVLIMRYTHPAAERPFRSPLFPILPLLGTFFCLLLMFSLPSENWLRLFVWLVIGLVIYFGYGRKHSVMYRLGKEQKASPKD